MVGSLDGAFGGLRQDRCADGRSFAVYEAATPPGVPGPPEDVRRNYDEASYIASGNMEFRLDGIAHTAPQGSVVFTPRDTAHTFRNPGPAEARMLAVVTPEVVPLIETLGELTAAGPPDPAAMRALLARHETCNVDDPVTT